MAGISIDVEISKFKILQLDKTFVIHCISRAGKLVEPTKFVQMHVCTYVCVFRTIATQYFWQPEGACSMGNANSVP